MQRVPNPIAFGGVDIGSTKAKKQAQVACISIHVLTEGHQFACHQIVATHVALFSWMAKAMTIEIVTLEKIFNFLIEFLRNLVDVVLTGPKPARSRLGQRRRLTDESVFHHLLYVVQNDDVEVTARGNDVDDLRHDAGPPEVAHIGAAANRITIHDN